MVTSDQTHIDPKSYFDPNGPRPTPSIIGQWWYIGVMPALGFASACIENFGKRRPIMSGLQKHALYVTIGLGLGVIVDKHIRDRCAKRDYFYYQYMCDHPEDFPLIERKKYKDIIETWYPIR